MTSYTLSRWVGKVAIVTGASSGIGYCIAKKLAEEGLHVVGLARRKDRMEELFDELGEKYTNFHPLECNLKREKEIIDAFLWTKAHLGAPSILINNAGVSPKCWLHDGPSEKFKNVMDINVMAVAIASREAIQMMREANINGHIININSIAGHYHSNFGDVGMYQASKFAVTAMTEQLRKELVSLKSKIRVTSVSPGITMTEMISTGERQGDVPENIPHLNAIDVAQTVIFALSTPPHVQVHELIVRPVGEEI